MEVAVSRGSRGGKGRGFLDLRASSATICLAICGPSSLLTSAGVSTWIGVPAQNRFPQLSQRVFETLIGSLAGAFLGGSGGHFLQSEVVAF